MNRLIALIALVFATGAAAQELNFARTSAANPDVFRVRTGLEHGLAAEVGYLRVLSLGDRQLFLGGDVATPWAKPDFHDYRARLTAGMPVLAGDRWKLAGWFSPTLRGTANAASSMTALGADLRLAGGYYSPRWFLAAELGADWVATTHVAFSDAYRSRIYADARDGWYGMPGGTTYAGLHGGVSFSSFDVVLRAGQPRTMELRDQTIPFYVTLGVNVALPLLGRP